MRRKALMGMALLVALAVAPAAFAASTSGLWVHVAVDDGDDRVRVNVPLSLVENLLPAINTREMRGGRIRIDAFDVDEIDGLDLEEMWRAIQEGYARHTRSLPVHGRTPDVNSLTVGSKAVGHC